MDITTSRYLSFLLLQNDHYNESLIINIKTINTIEQNKSILILINIGSIYTNEKKYEKAFQYYKEALYNFYKYKNSCSCILSFIYYSMANIEIHCYNYFMARVYIKLSLKHCNKKYSSHFMYKIYTKMLEIYKNLGLDTKEIIENIQIYNKCILKINTILPNVTFFHEDNDTIINNLEKSIKHYKNMFPKETDFINKIENYIKKNK